MLKLLKKKLTRFVLLGFVAMNAYADNERNDEAYLNWKSQNNISDKEVVEYLTKNSVESEIPLHQLFRSATDWKICRSQPFEITPKKQWPNIVSVLKLIKHLRSLSILGSFEVQSGYRNHDLNLCAHGAISSAHASAFALDITLSETINKQTEEALCKFWRQEGRKWKMGLSKYPSGRIHIDTHGYRTWGASHHKGSTYCKP